ncbi:hypothetical protein COCSUDRAFT_32692 [Coccomyxa subellipsoidea C-169]|uniref:Secreted protein n=1 Tax=Coccomyxa subellipsoidea (strain C-169) TaxID=574566 RepID=I0Z4K7_COCSC|nr:hypothetical protein COCSUDRAFT_32692 [Coccomyxa subellipsoidea C-169]EIE25576.1 hypothetical protein COCSUDRAFT_32692 [Coccomyxa subellipsoidea C-169]|eukprot:XP_005650120.1 hypothetical protein COCSUDRAFT_32692 [Coccomyxa subellipsoidea C-169]
MVTNLWLLVASCANLVSRQLHHTASSAAFLISPSPSHTPKRNPSLPIVKQLVFRCHPRLLKERGGSSGAQE